MSKTVRAWLLVTRTKRDFGTIRKRSNGRYQAYYMGLDEAFHRAPSTFQAKSDAEGWLAVERRLIQNDEWSPAKSRRAKVRRATEGFGPYASVDVFRRCWWGLTLRMPDAILLSLVRFVVLAGAAVMHASGWGT